jgi:hypothetical protein
LFADTQPNEKKASKARSEAKPRVGWQADLFADTQ